MFGYHSWLVVRNHLSWDLSDGVFGRFDLAALSAVCLFVCYDCSCALAACSLSSCKLLLGLGTVHTDARPSLGVSAL